MNNNNIIQLHSLNNVPRNVREDEAEKLVPHLIYIGRKTKKELNQLNSQLELFKGQPERREVVQAKIQTATQRWSEKMKRLGTTPIGLLKVKISTENGNYFWEFPHDHLFVE